jgi:hypothetical protein
MNDIAPRNGNGDGPLREHVPGQEFLGSLTDNARLRAEGIIAAGARDLDWERREAEFDRDHTGSARQSFVIDLETLGQIEAMVRAFDGKVEDLERRVARGQEIINHLARGGTSAGTALTRPTVDKESAAVDAFFGADGSSQSSAGVPDEIGPPANAHRREWLANVLTAVAILAVIFIVLAIVGTL